MEEGKSTENANKQLEEYINMMKDDIKKIEEQFKKSYEEKNYYTLTSLHQILFNKEVKTDPERENNQDEFQKSYELLQKFVYNTYHTNLPPIEFGKEIVYQTREEINEQLKSLQVEEIENYFEEVKKDPRVKVIDEEGVLIDKIDAEGDTQMLDGKIKKGLKKKSVKKSKKKSVKRSKKKSVKKSKKKSKRGGKSRGKNLK